MRSLMHSIRRLAPLVVSALTLLNGVAAAQGGLTNGEMHIGAISVAGEIDTWTFTATQGDSIAISIGEIPGGPDPTFAPWIRLQNPSGVQIASSSGALVGQINIAAPLSGTYTVLAASNDSFNDATGSYRLTLAKTPGTFVVPAGDQGGAMTNGGDHQGDIYIGDLDQWSFQANQNDLIVLSIGEMLPGGPDPGFNPWIRLIGPTGVVLGSSAGSLVAQIDVAAPLSGTYTVLVGTADSFNDAAGSYRLMLGKVPGTLAVPPGDQGGPMTNGVNHQGSIYVGDLDTWTFQAAQHDYLSLSVGEPPFGEVDPGFNPWIRLVSPTGVVIGNAAGTLVGQINVAAPLTGTYTVIVGTADSFNDAAGSYHLTLAKVPGIVTVPLDDQGGAMTNGANHLGHIHRGDLDQWTFTAAQNDYVVVSIGEPPFGETDPGFNPWIRLIGPTGIVVGSSAGTLTAQIGLNAPLSGTYTVLVTTGDSFNDAEGDYRLTYAKIPGTFVVNDEPEDPDEAEDNDGGPMINGATHDGNIRMGDLDQWTFTAGIGESLLVSIGEPPFGEVDPGFNPWIRLISPSGVLLASEAGTLAALLSVTAPLTGTYTVLVGTGDSFNDAIGNYRLTFVKVPGTFTTSAGDSGGPITTNNAVHTGAIYTGDLDPWTFSAAQGATITMRITEPPPPEVDPGFNPWILLYGPTGAFVAQASGALTAQISVVAPLSGTYTVVAASGDSFNDAAGNYELAVNVVTPSYTVTPVAGTNGTISPNTQQTVLSGQTIAFTLAPAAGFQVNTVTGTCGGSRVGLVFTTNPVVANCTVVASFVTVPPLTVTPSVVGNGTITPSTPQSVASGQTRGFTLAPAAGHRVSSVTGTCGGNLVGLVFTTNPVVASCTVVATFVPLPTMALDKTSLGFGATTNGAAFVTQTSAQVVRLIQSGAGTVTWTATLNQPWLQMSPASGTGSANLTVSVVPGPGLPATGSVGASITFAFTGASNNPGPVTVALNLIANGASAAPIGIVDTPTDNRTGVTGAVPFTGWALDDIGVSRVMVCRSAFGAEVAPADPNCGGAAQIFVGFAVSIDGARPDVAAAFPAYPVNTIAGWGFMVLTNMLPNQGNGTFAFHMYAQDPDGHTTLLGTRTMTCANAAATLPFGAIDTPTQGGVASGNAYLNFGWALTPQPKAIPVSGSTITVLVDGLSVGSVSYNHFRPDIAGLFPGLNNTNGAIGFKVIDTTTLANGTHTIVWVVTDDHGATEGVGSRFFTVANGAAAATAAAESHATLVLSPADVNGLPRTEAPLLGRRGWDLQAPYGSYAPTPSGRVLMRGEEIDRFELALGERAGVRYTGYLRTDADLTSLPIGSTLDASTGVFTWAPGVGFIGTYDLVFVRWEGAQAIERHEVRIVLQPKGRGVVGAQVVIDMPAPQQDVAQPFMLAGWAADLDAASGTGVATVHVWAYPLTGGPPIFLGVADDGGRRPDVAAVYGDQFQRSGYGLVVNGVVPGTYDLAVFGYSVVTGGFVPAKVVRVTIR